MPPGVARAGCSGARTPNPQLLAECLRSYAGEVVIDVIKHAVLGKFNEIRWVGAHQHTRMRAPLLSNQQRRCACLMRGIQGAGWLPGSQGLLQPSFLTAWMPVGALPCCPLL